LRKLPSFGARADRLAELNVLAQVQALHAMPLVQRARRPVQIHGWIFSMLEGRLKTLTDTTWTSTRTADTEAAVG
jgi:carbonic anhydrase